MNLKNGEVRYILIPIASDNMHFHLLAIDKKIMTFNYYNSLRYNDKKKQLILKQWYVDKLC